MEMVKLKTAELDGQRLDWAVIVAIKHIPKLTYYRNEPTVEVQDWTRHDSVVKGFRFHPATEHCFAGPLIERYCLGIFKHNPDVDSGVPIAGEEWIATSYADGLAMTGPDFITAAMRNIVMAEIGDEVEVPIELVEE